MITSKKELNEYLEADKMSLGRKSKIPIFYDYIWRYERALRYCEYYRNTNNSIFKSACLIWHRFRKMYLGMKCGYEIPDNVFGKGLSIAHMGSIIVNDGAKIGNYCRIHVGVNIGTAAGFGSQAPKVGDYAYIGPGAKIFGPIELGNDIAVGANAVVNKSFEGDKLTIAGIPAKVVNYEGSVGLVYRPES